MKLLIQDIPRGSIDLDLFSHHANAIPEYYLTFNDNEFGIKRLTDEITTRFQMPRSLKKLTSIITAKTANMLYFFLDALRRKNMRPCPKWPARQRIGGCEQGLL